MGLRQFVPPIVHQAVVRWKKSRALTVATYDEASQRSGKGYADADLAEMVLESTRRMAAGSTRAAIDDRYVVNTILAVSVAASLSPARPLRVMDLGGAFGSAYHLVNEILPVDLKWAIVESPTFVEVGRKVEQENLKFFNSLQEAKAWLGEVDLFYSSSTVQYMPDPKAVIKEALALDAKCMAWLRVAFSLADEFVELQETQLRHHGPGELPRGVKDRMIHIPRTWLALDEFKALMNEGYDLMLQYGDSDRLSSVGRYPVLYEDRFLYVRRGAR